MRSLAPWEMERLFDRFFEPQEELAGIGEWAPRMDVRETRDAFVVKAEIPGVEQEVLTVARSNVTATFKDGVLTVTLPKTPGGRG